MAEVQVTYDLTPIRTLHAVDATRWLGEGTAYWLEWDHPGETPRPFAGIIEGLEWVRWRQLIKPGSAAIDVGTHSGDTTIPMGLFAYDINQRQKGHIIGVEPNPQLHPIVEACFALNRHVANFYLEKCAITAEDVAEVELADHGNANCNGGILSGFNPKIREHLSAHQLTRYKAPGNSLATILNNYKDKFDARDLQFVKTDCEGYDKEIIRSAAEVLNQIKPALFIEWFDWFTVEESIDLFEVIKGANYVALHPGSLQPITATGERLSDITCIHRDRISELTP